MKLRPLAQVVCLIGVALCLLQLLAIAVYMVWHNRGLETYANVYGLRISWLSLIIDLAALAVVFTVGVMWVWVARLRDFREEGKLRRGLAARRGQTGRGGV